MLRENGDCQYCCGDHKSEDCYRKERKCGGGKESRGCKKDHHLHEMFCPEAKLCFVAQVGVVYVCWKLKEGGFWTRLILSKLKIAPKRLVSGWSYMGQHLVIE